MSTNKVGYIIALEKGRPVGIVTERDLVLKVMAEDKNPKEAKISDCMSSPLVTIEPDKSIEEAVEIMKKHGFRRLPVVKNNIIYGACAAADHGPDQGHGRLLRRMYRNILEWWRPTEDQSRYQVRICV
jgi:CBS domain-containing protein